MQGIKNIIWSGSTYGIQAITADGQTRTLTMASLPNILCESQMGDRKLRLNGRTHFQRWKAIGDDEIDAIHGAIGIETQLRGQSLYTFCDMDKTYVIPIGVAMCAIFRPFPGISRYLYCPQGLENLIVPSENVPKPTVQFYENARGKTGIQVDKAEGVLNSLSWMYCFPSARRAWNSVLDYARQGRLDMNLPLGNFSFSGRGIPIGGIILITELRIKLLETAEEPFPAFSEHTKLIEFQRILHSEQRMTGGSKKEQYLPRRTDNEAYNLTDAEWQQIKPLVEKTTQIPRQFSLREVIDGILLKLGRGIPWSKVPGLPFRNSLLPRTYSRMQKDGRWECLLNILKQFRPRAITEEAI